ncbi:MAG: type II secretion system minor pseudopilin GspH [Thermodesulfobacteriota bacterium]
MPNSKGDRFIRAGGFTLLEILVVIVIISIVLSMATMSFDTEPEKLDHEGKRLVALMKLAAEEAIMNSREYRVVFTADSYAFAKLAGGKWQELGDGVFRPRELPGEFILDLTLGNEPVELVVDNGENEKSKSSAAIMFLSSGEVSPFELVIQNTSGKEITISNQSGVIEVDSGQL